MRTRYGQFETMCLQCRRKQAGDEWTVCPHCGASRTIRVELPSMDLFNRAFPALQSRGMIRKSVDPGGGLGGLGTAHGLSPRGTIWVDLDRQEEMAQALGEAGLDILEWDLPIVDRSDPACPECGAKIDAAAATECPACHLAFQWVDIHEPPVDPTGRLCVACGYDLTGTTEARCPECSTPFVQAADALVAAALAGSGEGDPTDTRGAAGHRGAPTATLVLAFFAIGLGLLLLVTKLDFPIVIALVVWVVCGVILMFFARLGWREQAD